VVILDLPLEYVFVFVQKRYDLCDGKLLLSHSLPNGHFTTLTFNPQELLLACATTQRTIKIFDVERCELVRE